MLRIRICANQLVKHKQNDFTCGENNKFWKWNYFIF